MQVCLYNRGGGRCNILGIGEPNKNKNDIAIYVILTSLSASISYSKKKQQQQDLPHLILSTDFLAVPIKKIHDRKFNI